MAITLQIYNTYICPGTNAGMDIGEEDKQFNDLYLTGLAYIDGFGEGFDMGDFNITSMGKIYGYDSHVYLDMSVDGKLDLIADVDMTFVSQNIYLSGNLDVTSNITAGGRLKAEGYFVQVVTKTASYTATLDDDVILCDTTGGAITITLPSAYDSNTDKKVLTIKALVSSSGNPVTIQGESGENIDGGSTLTIYDSYDYYTLVADNASSGWYTI